MAGNVFNPGVGGFSRGNMLYSRDFVMPGTVPAETMPGTPSSPTSPPVANPFPPVGSWNTPMLRGAGAPPQYMAPQRRPSGYRFSDPRAARHMAATTRPAYGGPNSNDFLMAQIGLWQQPQQQASFPFQLPGLGDFYTPHSMGDAQNTSNSTVGANFLGSYMPPRSAPPRPF